jgi:TetR/AcrR family transcriptional regulator
MKLIDAKGVRGATTKAVAREIGISEEALYRHFRTRDEDLSHVNAQIGAGFREIARGVSLDGRDPLGQLEDLVLRAVRFVEAHPGIPGMTYLDDVYLHRPDLRRQMWTDVEGYLARIREVLEDGKRAGTIRRDVDTGLLAMMLVGVTQMLTFRWSLSGFAFPLAERAAATWQCFRSLVSANSGGGSPGRADDSE